MTTKKHKPVAKRVEEAQSEYIENLLDELRGLPYEDTLMYVLLEKVLNEKS